MLTVGYEWLSIAMFGIYFDAADWLPVSLSFAATAILF